MIRKSHGKKLDFTDSQEILLKIEEKQEKSGIFIIHVNEFLDGQ